MILVNHALTGNSLVSGINGWWSEVIGLEKPIDTSKYSVLCFNIPGNGFNENNFDFNLDLNLGDIALLFVKALDQLKLAKLHAIIGGSIGGCLTWEMIALKNDLASIIIPVAADWKATDWLIANTFLQERILKNSRDPVSDARIHAMTFYRSPKSLNTRFTRTKNLDKNMYNEARRFITLIDIIYEKKNNLVIRAEKNIEDIFILKKNKELPFLRTASRIKEMTTKAWVKKRKGE